MKQSDMLLLFGAIYTTPALPVMGSWAMGAVCFVAALLLMWKGEMK